MDDFEQLKATWQNENQADLFDIDHQKLHEKIAQKGRSVERLLKFFEWVMIGSNLIVAIVLFWMLDGAEKLPHFYLFPIFYLGYFFLALAFSFWRRKKEKQFPQSIAGDLDRALWRINYFIRFAHSLFYIYAIPLTVVYMGAMLFEGQYWEALWMPLLWIFTYFGAKWEMKKFYLPKKDGLLELQKQLQNR